MVYYNNKIYPLNSVKKNLPNIFLWFFPVLVELFWGTIPSTPFGIHVSMVPSDLIWVGHHVSDDVVEPELDTG
jgi:hypothetical protein